MRQTKRRPKQFKGPKNRTQDRFQTRTVQYPPQDRVESFDGSTGVSEALSYFSENTQEVRQWIRHRCIRDKKSSCRPSGAVVLLRQETGIDFSEQEFAVIALTEGYKCSSRDFNQAFLDMQVRDQGAIQDIMADYEHDWDADSPSSCFRRQEPKETDNG